MTNRVEAVYEKGVFRPKEPVPLTEGSTVELTFETPSLDRPTEPLVKALLEIARMPSKGPKDGFSGADHDRILYGREGR